MKCVLVILQMLKNLIIADWPQALIVDNGRNSWVPIRAQINRERVLHDFVNEEKLVLIQETTRRITLKNMIYNFTISFIKGEDSGVRYIDLDNDEKRFWIAEILYEKDLLRYYFEDKYIKKADIPEPEL